MGMRNRGISGGRGCKVERGKELAKEKRDRQEERKRGFTHEVISIHAPALAYFPFPRFVQPDIAAGSQLLFTLGNE